MGSPGMNDENIVEITVTCAERLPLCCSICLDEPFSSSPRCRADANVASQMAFGVLNEHAAMWTRCCPS